MKLTFLAHAAFLLNLSQGTRILIAPHEPGFFDGALEYPPIKDEVDTIVITQESLSQTPETWVLNG